ncbi:hypothetical protein GUJ93_ZPchr0010g11016 [Zizania palustris]|uniref:Uncharacterized protein n=1 Tax=Zizania palustris TaxID=103762 RepID=A0A8J6BI05_ZIZPA|nr:hypothetical protein GUJ93_ZPchr0010g11016 [Zizania palustris]
MSSHVRPPARSDWFDSARQVHVTVKLGAAAPASFEDAVTEWRRRAGVHCPSPFFSSPSQSKASSRRLPASVSSTNPFFDRVRLLLAPGCGGGGGLQEIINCEVVLLIIKERWH